MVKHKKNKNLVNMQLALALTHPAPHYISPSSQCSAYLAPVVHFANSSLLHFNSFTNPPVLLSYQKRGHLTNHKTLKFTQFTNSTGVDCYHHDNAASWSGHQDRWKRQWKQWNYLCWNLQPIMVTAKQQKPPPPSWWKEASKRKEQNLNSQKQAYFVQ